MAEKVKTKQIVITQVVDKAAKETLDKVTFNLGKKALDLGRKQPGKGEVLSALIAKGAKEFDITGYFTSNA